MEQFSETQVVPTGPFEEVEAQMLEEYSAHSRSNFNEMLHRNASRASLLDQARAFASNITAAFTTDDTDITACEFEIQDVWYRVIRIAEVFGPGTSDTNASGSVNSAGSGVIVATAPFFAELVEFLTGLQDIGSLVRGGGNPIATAHGELAVTRNGIIWKDLPFFRTAMHIALLYPDSAGYGVNGLARRNLHGLAAFMTTCGLLDLSNRAADVFRMALETPGIPIKHAPGAFEDQVGRYPTVGELLPALVEWLEFAGDWLWRRVVAELRFELEGHLQIQNPAGLGQLAVQDGVPDNMRFGRARWNFWRKRLGEVRAMAEENAWIEVSGDAAKALNNMASIEALVGEP